MRLVILESPYAGDLVRNAEYLSACIRDCIARQESPYASHRMLTESDRLTALVLQIIELSRLQGDEPLESPEAVDVDQIIASAADTTSVDAARKGISIRIGAVATGCAVLASLQRCFMGH